MLIRLFALTLLLLTPAFAQEADSPAPAASTTAMPAAPEDVDRLFGEFWNTANAEGIVSLYEPDAILVGLDGTMVQGTEAIRAAVASFGLGASTIEMNVVNVARPADDLAVLFNRYAIRGKNPDGSPLEITGKAMEVVRRQSDGTWRYTFDHPAAGDGIGWSAPTPAASK